MARITKDQTINELTARVQQQSQLIEEMRFSERSLKQQTVKLGVEIEDHKKIISDLRSQVQWHRQLNQNLVERMPRACSR